MTNSTIQIREKLEKSSFTRSKLMAQYLTAITTQRTLSSIDKYNLNEKCKELE